MAYQLLYTMCGIPCQVISGRLNSNTHYWNLILLNGDYYHVDCSACIGNPVSSGFLFSDSQMVQKYWWDVDKYPACSGELTIQRVMDVILARQIADEEGSTDTAAAEN